MLIVSPEGRRDEERVALNPLHSLDVTIGILENTKDNARLLLESMRAALLAEGEGSPGQLGRKLYSTVPAEGKLVERLAADSGLVLVGSGDCGSCSTRCVNDTIALERAGVPAVVVVTEGFEPIARLVAEYYGMPDIRMIVVSHPLGGTPEPEVRKMGASAARLLREMLAHEQDAAVSTAS